MADKNATDRLRAELVAILEQNGENGLVAVGMAADIAMMCVREQANRWNASHKRNQRLEIAASVAGSILAGFIANPSNDKEVVTDGIVTDALDLADALMEKCNG